MRMKLYLSGQPAIHAPLLAGSQVTLAMNGPSTATVYFHGHKGFTLDEDLLDEGTLDFNVLMHQAVTVSLLFTESVAGELEVPILRGIIVDIQRKDGRQTDMKDPLYQIQASIQDASYYLDRAFFNTSTLSFPGGVASDADIVRDVITGNETSQTPANITSRIDEGTIGEYTDPLPDTNFLLQTGRQLIDKMRQGSGANFWLVAESGGKSDFFYQHPDFASSTLLHYTDIRLDSPGSYTPIKYGNFDAQESWPDAANTVTVIGDGGALQRTAASTASIAQYGNLNKIIYDSQLTDGDYAQQLADATLALTAFPSHSYRVSYVLGDLVASIVEPLNGVGSTARLTNQPGDIHGEEFLIVRKSFRQLARNETEIGLELNAAIQDVTQLLRRLDRQQGSLAQLV